MKKMKKFTSRVRADYVTAGYSIQSTQWQSYKQVTTVES